MYLITWTFLSVLQLTCSWEVEDTLPHEIEGSSIPLAGGPQSSEIPDPIPSNQRNG